MSKVALWPERYSLDLLENIRATIGSLAFTCLYQGNPTQAEGTIFKREWWKYYDELPISDMIVMSLDSAFKKGQGNDYSVFTTWARCYNGYYLLHVWRQKVEYPELKRAAISLAAKFRPNALLIEDKASGQSLIQELRRETRLPVLPIKVDSDKVARANAVTPAIEAGKAYLPKVADWLYDYLEEMSAFPHGRFDDQVDSSTQAIDYMRRPSEPKPKIVTYDAMAAVGNMDL